MGLGERTVIARANIVRLAWIALSAVAASAFMGWFLVLISTADKYAVPATWCLVTVFAALAYSRLQVLLLTLGGIPLPLVTLYGLLWGDPVVFLVLFVYSLACVFCLLDAESRHRSSHAQ
jgi:hypothetical protein